jgi:hypothetical protein
MALTKVTYPMIDGFPPSQILHQVFQDNYTDGVVVVRDGSIDGNHRHFGGVAEGVGGRLHLTTRFGPQHGVASGTSIKYSYSDNGGLTWSTETTIVAAEAGFDQREQSICVTPTGRILVIYSKVPAPSAAPVVLKLIYSDDNGQTWVQGNDVVTINQSYARTYGRIKLIPGDNGVNYRLAITPYYASGGGNFKVAVWTSEDDGLSWTERTSIINNTTGYSETELTAISSQIWFAVSRSNTGLAWWKTTNAGASWTYIGQIPRTTSDSQVAPSLDKFYKNGQWYVLLGYTNRVNDTSVWRICDATSALSTAELFGGEIITATDLENASGYQSAVVKRNGDVYFEEGTLFVVFKEYIGFNYSQVRIQTASFDVLSKSATRIVAVASGEVTISQSEFNYLLAVDTEGGAATDDLDTINGGYENQILTVLGNTTTSTRDVTLKSGTGNLILAQDYRINTNLNSRITLLYQNGFWYELARTPDDLTQGYTIASGVLTVPTATSYAVVFAQTEGGAATDDIDTITGGVEGQLMTFMTSTSSEDVTFKNGTDNLRLAGDFTLDTSLKTITLVKRGTLWYEISRSANV